MNVGNFVLRFVPRQIADRITAVPFARRLARGAFWVLVGAVAARVLRMPISIILARLMGPTKYGELGIVSGSIDLFATFAGFGLGLTATKYVAEFRTRDPLRAGRILAASTVVAAVSGAIFAIALVAIAPVLAARTLANPHLTGPLRIGAVAMLFSAMNGAQMGALYGFEAFKIVAYLQAALGVLDLPFMLAGYFLGGLNGVLWGMACSRLSAWLLMGFALRAEARRNGVHIVFDHWKHELAVLWHFSVPAALAGVMVMPVNWICSTILVNQPRGYAAMGIFSAANQWNSVLLFLPVVLGSGLLPILSDRMGERDGRSSRKILKVMMQLNGIIVVPCAIGMSLFSPWIMHMYGQGYRDAWSTLIATVWAAAVIAILTPVGDVIAASGRMWLGLLMNAGWALIYIIATVLLVRWGSLGLASARLIAYAVHATWASAFAYRLIARNSVMTISSESQETAAATTTWS